MRFAFTSLHTLVACGLFVAACILYSRDWSTLCSSPCDARKVGLRLSLAAKRSTNANSNATLLKDSSKGAQTGQAPGLQDLSLQAEVEWDFLGLMGSCQSEGDPAICGWCNSTFSKQNPIAWEDRKRSYRQGGACGMPDSVLKKVQAGSNVIISVVGGSMTHGNGCEEGGLTRQECAWPNRMRKRLSMLLPDANITINNLAQPGWHYGSWVQNGNFKALNKTDILIVDDQVNSQIYGTDHMTQMQELDKLLYTVLSIAAESQRQLGVLFVESFRTCASNTADCKLHCPYDQQGHMTYNYSGKEGQYHWCNRWWMMADMERPIVNHYKLPIASYRDAVWPVITEPSPHLPCMWNRLSHGDAIMHSLFADIVAYGVVRTLVDAQHRYAKHAGFQCHLPPRFFQHMPLSTTCQARLRSNSSVPSVFIESDKADSANSGPAWVVGNWRLYEDRPGKPGWIFDVDSSPKSAAPPGMDLLASNNTISATKGSKQHIERLTGNDICFKVKLSSKPQLEVTFLTSYERIGSVMMSLFKGRAGAALSASSPAVASFTINGTISQRYSIPKTTTFGSGKGLDLPAALSEGDYHVVFTPLHGTTKFKLLSIISC